MSRLSLGLVLVVGILAGGLGVTLLNRAPAPMNDAQVRGIVSDMLAADSAGTIDTAQVNQLIEDYLMADPAILERMSARLNDTRRLEQRQSQIALLEANATAIYDDPANVIIGNPEGDVTLVELFDYNCGYCRRALPDLATLIAEDPNLRVILKEFPILSDASVAAAKVAYLVAADERLDYWDFHQRLFSARGQIDGPAAIEAAAAVGGARMELMINMEGPLPAQAIERTYDLAKALQITGTPTFIIGDELIPGAVGVDVLRAKIANMRDCGSATCPAA